MDNLRYTIVALLGMGMAACTDNVTETDNAQEYGASARNIQVSVLTKCMSRTETGEPFSNSFYLYIDQTGTENDYFVKMKYNTEVGSGWTVDGNEQELLLIDSPENFRFSAMCFQDDGTAITLDEYCSAEHVYLGGKDILYAKSGDDGCSIDNEGRLEISFSHLFSKLSFSFEKEGSAGGGETSEGGISEGTLPESIVASGISNKFTWTASTGDFSYGRAVLRGGGCSDYDSEGCRREVHLFCCSARSGNCETGFRRCFEQLSEWFETRVRQGCERNA